MYCEKCWKKNYRLYAIIFPVAGPVDAKWTELRESLRTAWIQSTAVCNWFNDHLYQRDIVRSAEMKKLPAFSVGSLYQEAKLQFMLDEYDSALLASIENSQRRKYFKKRYEVKWLGSASNRSERYPQPYPIRWQGCKAEIINECPVVTCTIARKRFKLRLRGGTRFQRQLYSFKQIVSGEALAGEVVLYRQRDRGSKGDRIGTKENGQRYKIMCKLVAWFPRIAQTQGGTGTLFTRTDSDSMIIALNVKDEKLWIIHADQIRRWSAEHRVRLQRWSDDQKAEERPVASFWKRRELACLKYRNRMNTFIGQTAAKIANYAERRNFAVVEYDDSDQDYCEKFPYSDMCGKINEKVSAKGIEFVKKGSEK